MENIKLFPMFAIPLYITNVYNWKTKKDKLLGSFNNLQYITQEQKTNEYIETNFYHSDGMKEDRLNITDILSEELSEFCSNMGFREFLNESQMSIEIDKQIDDEKFKEKVLNYFKKEYPNKKFSLKTIKDTYYDMVDNNHIKNIYAYDILGQNELSIQYIKDLIPSDFNVYVPIYTDYTSKCMPVGSPLVGWCLITKNTYNYDFIRKL
jgi:hypothetical protein